MGFSKLFGGVKSIHKTVLKGDIEAVEEMINSGVDINQPDKKGIFPLGIALREGYTSIVDLLLKSGAVVNPETQISGSYLHGLCAQQWQVAEMARSLIKYGAEIDLKDKNGATPLFFAVMEGKTELAKVLIDAGANINTTDNFGAGLLAVALAKGHWEMAEFLAIHNINPNFKSQNGNTAAHMAFMVPCPVETMRFLIEKGLDINVQNNNGETALHIAVETHNLGMIELLEEKGAKVNLQTKDGLTPLHIAVEMRSTTITEILLRNGADKNIKTKDGKFPIDFIKRIYTTEEKLIKEMLQEKDSP